MLRCLLICSLLLVAGNAFADYQYLIYNSTGMTTCPPESAPLPLDCMGMIYWDQNENGPDAADAPPPVGALPGQCNFNTFPLNGEAGGFPPHAFLTDPMFIYHGSFPVPVFYVVFECAGVRLTSRTFTGNGAIMDVQLDDGWTCEAIVDTCLHAIELYLWDLPSLPEDHRRIVYTDCIWLCAGVPVTMHVAGLDDLWGVRHAYATIAAGCGGETACNSNVVSPAASPLWENGQTTVDFTEFWQGTSFTLNSPVAGWACLYVDIFLPVEQGSIDAVAGDGRVTLNWNTLSETGVDRFEVLRKTVTSEYEVIGSIPAENNAAGSHYSFLDEQAINDVSYAYTLSVVNLDGSRQEWGVEVNATPRANIVSQFALHQNYPNPFNPETQIEFDLAASEHVTLTVFNTSGQTVTELVNGTLETGAHTVNFNGSVLSAGVYFYRLQAGSFTETRKMLLLK